MQQDLGDNAARISERLRDLGEHFGHSLDDAFKDAPEAERPQYLHDFADAVQAFRTATEDNPDVGSTDTS